MKIKINQWMFTLTISCLLILSQINISMGQEVLEQDQFEEDALQDDQNLEDEVGQDQSEEMDSDEASEEMEDDDFKPTFEPYGRVHTFLEGALNKKAEEGNEAALQFRVRTIMFGFSGKVHPNISYDILAFRSESPRGNVVFALETALIDIAIVPDVLKIALGRDATFSLITREAKSGGKLLFSNFSSILGVVETSDFTGLKVHGNLMANKFHYSLFLVNADSRTITKFDSSMKAHKFGLRLEYDFMQPWSHGNEWLRNRTNGTIGVAMSFSPWEERKYQRPVIGDDASSIEYEDSDPYYSRKNMLRLGVDLGFSISILYLQGAFGILGGKGVASDNSEFDLEGGIGYNFDIAVSLMKNRLVPAVRIESSMGSTDENSDFGYPERKGSKREKMALWFVINWLPMASHAFKLQPELYMELTNKDTQGIKRDKKVRVRLSAILNF